MSIFGKIMTALRGGVTEAGQAIVDDQALRILDQEIRDADVELGRAREALTQVMAQRKLADRAVSEARAEISGLEGHAIKCLERGEEALATEVAERIASLEEAFAHKEKAASEFARGETTLRSQVSQIETKLNRLRQESQMVRATEAVQKAQEATITRFDGATSSLGTAAESLERIKKRQTERAARFEAAQELAASTSGSDLESRLKAAGITSGNSSANDVLARLKARQQ